METIIKINLDKYSLEAEAILVIDTVEKTAPAKGGIRVHAHVSEEEIASLAAEMTLKCILAGLPFGGAKGGIRISDPEQIERAMFAFGRELSKIDFLPYRWCAAPDVNTDSKSIDAFIAGCASVKGWRKARIAATGKSSGIPHELGGTAFGVVLSIEKAIEHLGLDIALDNVGVIVEGIGEVGGNAVKILGRKGARILGVSDITGALYLAGGLDRQTLYKAIDGRLSVAELAGLIPEAEFCASSASLLEREADILILAGPGRSITSKNAPDLKVRLIAEGANIAYENGDVRGIVHQKGIISIPGIIANSGGVISSYEEWLLENQDLMDLAMDEKWERVKASIELRISRNIKELCRRLRACGFEMTPLDCALEMARDRQRQMRESNRELRLMTKRVNKELEDKFEVYTR